MSAKRDRATPLGLGELPGSMERLPWFEPGAPRFTSADGGDALAEADALALRARALADEAVAARGSDVPTRRRFDFLLEPVDSLSATERALRPWDALRAAREVLDAIEAEAGAVIAAGRRGA